MPRPSSRGCIRSKKIGSTSSSSYIGTTTESSGWSRIGSPFGSEVADLNSVRSGGNRDRAGSAGVADGEQALGRVPERGRDATEVHRMGWHRAGRERRRAGDRQVVLVV